MPIATTSSKNSLNASKLEGIFYGKWDVFFPAGVTCPPDLPDSCWQPWSLPNDPPENSYGEIHEYDLLVKFEPTSHPAYFHYIQWFRGGSGNWHKQSGALIVRNHKTNSRNAEDSINFFSTNITSGSSIEVEGDGIQYVEGLTEGILYNKNKVIIDYIGLEQQAVGTAGLKRVKIIGGSDEKPIIQFNDDSSTYLMDVDGYPELIFSGNQDLSSHPDSNAPEASSFSFGASDVKVKTRKNDKLTFIFDADDASSVTTFTDGPDPLTGQMNMKRFAKKFTKIFGDDDPNVSITHWQEGFNIAVCEIKDIKVKKNGQYAIRTDLLAMDMPSGTKMPGILAEASFFVDYIHPFYAQGE